jgi:hypothetical protein
MAASSLVLALEQFAEFHAGIPNPYSSPQPYKVWVYTTWNSNSRELWKDEQGWHMRWKIDKKNYTDKVISTGRLHAIANMMKKRTARGCHMLTEVGGPYSEQQSKQYEPNGKPGSYASE